MFQMTLHRFPIPCRALGRTISSALLGVRTTLSQDKNDKRRVERRYLKYAGVGMQFGIAIALFTLGGRWLDGQFPKLEPLFTLLGFAVAFVGGTVSLVYQVLGSERVNKQ